VVTSAAGERAWRPDVLLGDDFSVLPVADATLVRYNGPVTGPARGAVLHVHGYNDYFFQRHVAEAFAAQGYLFYAVDLRAAGRSLQSEQIPHFVTDLHEQAYGLALAAQRVRRDHPDLPLIMHAHSTGGLTTPLWANAFRDATGEEAGPDAIVLDSPFLALPGGWLARDIAGPLSEPIGRIRPAAILSRAPSGFTTLMAQRWDFDHWLKRPEGLPLRLGWLRAVQRGQHRIRAGLDLRIPVLVATSGASSADRGEDSLADSTDTVLDVEAVWNQAPRLGADVRLVKIDGGVHDLTLSEAEPRQRYFDTVFEWLDDHFPRDALSERSDALSERS